MKETKLNEAISILGPKMVNSLLRISHGKMKAFEYQLNKLVKITKQK